MSEWGRLPVSPSLPKLSRRVDLVAGLIPVAAFGLRVFASCFIGVPAVAIASLALACLVQAAGLTAAGG
jgi:hypothetical protein